jgi:hypothetical protein
VCGRRKSAVANERIIMPTAPDFAAAAAPLYRSPTTPAIAAIIGSVRVDALVEKDDLPFALLAERLGLIEAGDLDDVCGDAGSGRPSLMPSARIAIGCGTGLTMRPLASPRTQCGTIAFSARTFSRPSRFISSRHQMIAFSRFSEPERRGPMRSQSHASLRYAASLRSPVSTIRWTGSASAAPMTAATRPASARIAARTFMKAAC